MEIYENFELIVQSGFNFPIFVINGFILRDQLNQRQQSLIRSMDQL